MVLVRVAAPTALPVSSAEAAQHLRLDEAQVDHLELLLQAATDYLDGRDGILGRALMRQTWDLKLDGFPWNGESDGQYGYIAIPLPPLVSVTSVKYIDTAGVEQTWPNTEYVVDLAENRLYLAYGKVYPFTIYQPNAVTVRFVAGHTVDTLPASQKLKVLLLAAHWHEHREPVVIGQSPASIPYSLEMLLTADRLL